MANFFTGGRDTFNAATFGMVSQNTAAFFQSRREEFFPSLAPMARAFHESVNDIYRGYDESLAMRTVRAAVRALKGMWRPDGISVCSEIGHFQHASYEMQRWCMAEPQLRQMHLTQQCHGYGDTYVDNDPGARPGWTHYDYRRATNTLYMEEGEERMVASSYFEDLLPGDRDLSIEEQSEIQESWGHLRHHLMRRIEDPTDPMNGSL